jgi:hypothetical protein
VNPVLHVSRTELPPPLAGDPSVPREVRPPRAIGNPELPEAVEPAGLGHRTQSQASTVPATVLRRIRFAPRAPKGEGTMLTVRSLVSRGGLLWCLLFPSGLVLAGTPARLATGMSGRVEAQIDLDRQQIRGEAWSPCAEPPPPTPAGCGWIRTPPGAFRTAHDGCGWIRFGSAPPRSISPDSPRASRSSCASRE